MGYQRIANARFDKASLCGHYEVVQFLLESGALCERDTFQGERCLYNALNDRIRNLLLSYDYSKSTDPLQPFAAHITSLLTRDTPQTSDILVSAVGDSFHLHKFVLSARSPYFRKKLSASPETSSWKIPPAIPPQAFGIAMRYVYLGEIPSELGGGVGTGYSEDEVLQGIDKVSKQLEISSLFDAILENDDRRLSRQRRGEELEKGRNQIEAWFTDNVLGHKVIVDAAKADDARWDRHNGIFADVLLRADEPLDQTTNEDQAADGIQIPTTPNEQNQSNSIPIGPLSTPSHRSASRKSTLFPAHRAMLLRSEFFLTMFSSAFREAQPTPYLQIIPLDIPPDILEVVLTFLYTEKADFGLDLAIDVLFAADLLLIERLKQKAAVVISTAGTGTTMAPSLSDLHIVGKNEYGEATDGLINMYDAVRAGWLTRVPRLEEFGAKHFAYRLEHFIDEPEFADLIRESAERIQGRQETDSIELLDDIRFYLSERFRLRLEEDFGVEEMVDEGSGAIATEEKAREADGQGTIEVAATHSHENGTGDLEGNADPKISIRKDGELQGLNGAIKTLDGEIAGDEIAADALNYQILLGKIDTLLDRLKLDA